MQNPKIMIIAKPAGLLETGSSAGFLAVVHHKFMRKSPSRGGVVTPFKGFSDISFLLAVGFRQTNLSLCGCAGTGR